MSEDLIKVAVLEQRVQDLKEFVLKVDEAIEKISQVNVSLTKMIAVHEEKIDTRERAEKSLNEKIDTIYTQMQEDHKNVLTEIKTLSTNIDKRLTDVEKGQNKINLKIAVVLGIGAFLGFVIQNSGFFVKILAHPQHLTTPVPHATMAPVQK
jgi:chromosome segregation ATPase